MPPRLSTLLSRSALMPILSTSRALTPIVSKQTSLLQTRNSSILGNLQDIPSSYNKRIRRGRGPSSGKGKTSGRGHKGQKQHGKVPFKFNGGQTKDEVVHGKRGFVNTLSPEMTILNLDRVQSWIDQGRLDPSKPITVKELHKTRCTHGIKDGVKLLGKDSTSFRSPVQIIVSRASASAISAIEAAGGSVTTRYYTRNSIRRILKGETHPVLSLLSPEVAASAQTPHPPSQSDNLQEGAVQADTGSIKPSILSQLPHISTFKYRLPDPASRSDVEYYRDPAHRGYLSYTIAEGQGPSLFFKNPTVSKMSAREVKFKKGLRKGGTSAQGSGRVW